MTASQVMNTETTYILRPTKMQLLESEGTVCYVG